MANVTPIAALTVPLGGQRIELQEIDYETGGMRLLRVRIREGRRFTVFDIDHQTARAWAEVMASWAARANQEGQEGSQ